MRIDEITEEEAQAFFAIGQAIRSGRHIDELRPQIDALTAMQDRLLSLAAQHNVQSGWRIRVEDLVKRLEEEPRTTNNPAKQCTELVF